MRRAADEAPHAAAAGAAVYICSVRASACAKVGAVGKHKYAFTRSTTSETPIKAGYLADFGCTALRGDFEQGAPEYMRSENLFAHVLPKSFGKARGSKGGEPESRGV